MSDYIPAYEYFEYDTSDVDAAALAIHRFADYIDDEAVLEGAKRIAMDDMARRFENETDPFGRRWAPLNPKYELKKAEEGYPVRPILSRTFHTGNLGSLRSSATDESAWSVTAESVWFHTDGLPPYWEAHEGGAEPRMIYKEVNGRQLEHGEFGGLPQRRFIGLSDHARDQIEELVSEWLELGLAKTTAPFEAPTGIGSLFKGRTITSAAAGAGGKLQYRTSGRFGPMA